MSNDWVSACETRPRSVAGDLNAMLDCSAVPCIVSITTTIVIVVIHMIIIILYIWLLQVLGTITAIVTTLYCRVSNEKKLCVKEAGIPAPKIHIIVLRKAANVLAVMF